MADSHKQVNHNGTTSERKTELWSSDKVGKENIIRNIFERNCWRVKSIENISGSHWKIITKSEIEERKINLYISSIRDEARAIDEFKTQLGNTYPQNGEAGWITLVLGIYVIKEPDDTNPEYLLASFDIDSSDLATNPSLRGVRTAGLQKALINGVFHKENCTIFKPDYIYAYLSGCLVSGNKISGDNQSSNIPEDLKDQPRQQIFYGAPGTGKSYKIKKDVEDEKRIYFRTTFHPDSDYSTFVGCYKPTMNKVRGYDEEGYIENEGMTRDGENHEPETKGEIIYSFTPQAFTNAYIKAWQTKEPVFLIIEEINRGNCAQIFGDLFQLLDRDEDGYSQYMVDADTDLADYISKHLQKAEEKERLTQTIRDGKKLQLPNNLYIWATMNTSDQSLFPIDSAFKRRWEWVYRPIAEGEGEYEIEGQGENSWWKFIQGINEVIDTTTHSEDKKLGYYFCKPAKKESKIISKNTFVNKVVFYLWNDVFKVYGFKSDIFDKEVSEKDTKKITFKDFYKDDGEVNDDTIKTFVQKVMAKAPKDKTKTEEENQQGEQNDTQTEA